MKMTLEEIMNTCSDWHKFCEAKGWSVHSVADGGGTIEQELTLDEAREFGIIPPTAPEK